MKEKEIGNGMPLQEDILDEVVGGSGSSFETWTCPDCGAVSEPMASWMLPQWINEHFLSCPKKKKLSSSFSLPTPTPPPPPSNTSW